MAVTKNGLQGSFAARFHDFLGDVELGSGIFIDGGFGADDFHVDIFPCYAELARFEAGLLITFLGGFDFVL
jgi:hypothetical protein